MTSSFLSFFCSLQESFAAPCRGLSILQAAHAAVREPGLSDSNLQTCNWTGRRHHPLESPGLSFHLRKSSGFGRNSLQPPLEEKKKKIVMHLSVELLRCSVFVGRGDTGGTPAAVEPDELKDFVQKERGGGGGINPHTNPKVHTTCTRSAEVTWEEARL